MVSGDEISLPDELEPGEAAPYRRRQKVVPVRRVRALRATSLLRGSLFVVFVLGPVGYIGYRATLFALTSPRFMVRSGEDVKVESNRYVSNKEVLAALGFSGESERETPVNIFRYSLLDARKQVESIPWVRSASATRAFPNHIIVRVVERTPVAFATVGGMLKLVDADGVLLDRPEKASFEFPVINGFDYEMSAADRKQRVKTYQDFLRDIAPDAGTSGWVVSEVDLSDEEDLRATVFRGKQTMVLHLGRADFRTRFRNFLALLAQLGNDSSRIESIDLRYGGQVVVHPRQSAASGSQTAPTGDSRRLTR
jgi:cell division septal protein FtsQ